MSIRIAIDCRPLVGQRAGIGRYLFELIGQFAERDDSIEFHLYSPVPFEVPAQCVTNSRFITRIHNITPGVLWLNMVVPQWIKEDSIDVFWGPNYAMPLVKSKNCEYVITIHDATYIRFPHTMRWDTRLHHQTALPLYAKLADRVITDSFFSKQELETLMKLNSTKVNVVHLASSVSKQSSAFVPKTESPYILSVGTIEPRKNVECLVQAFSKLPRSIRKTHKLIIAGGIGWGAVNPHEWFQRYGVEDSAVFLGRVDDNQLEYLYGNAKLFVFPSLYEGFGLPILEAMDNGVPVICSAGSSLPEVAGEAALYFEPSSASDLVDKLSMALEDDDLLNTLRQRGLERCKIFTWDKAARETLDYLIGGRT